MKVHSDEYGTISYKDLDVKDGDVIVVKSGASQESIDSLAEMLGSTGRPHSIIVVVNRMSDIKSLDQSIMNNYGWYRSDRARMTEKFLESKIVEERQKGEDSMSTFYDGIYFVLTGRYYE